MTRPRASRLRLVSCSRSRSWPSCRPGSRSAWTTCCDAHALVEALKVVVLGGGSTGEHFVGALRRLDADAEITLVESRLIGGECSYFACMPTKTMLRAAELSSSLDRAPGLAPEKPEQSGVWSWRDWVTSDWDDSGQVDWLKGQRCELVRGHGRVARAGVVDVEGRELEYDRL